jgi:AraC-like DNA-binding protein
VPEDLRPIARSDRGILDPERMRQSVEHQRFAPPSELAGIVDWIWTVSWRLPAGTTHRQDVVPSPSVNITIGRTPPPSADPPPGPYPLHADVFGVSRARIPRMLSDTGWNVAAKTTVGGFGALVGIPVAELTDRVQPIAGLLDLPADIADQLERLPSQAARAQRLADLLTAVAESADPHRIELAREIGSIASRAETDRSIRRVGDLARPAGYTVRTLQRLFKEYVGVSPSWVIRRWRLLDAAELARDGQRVDWAEMAAELGYADQSHLVRDFRAVLGTTPQAYARSTSAE